VDDEYSALATEPAGPHVLPTSQNRTWPAVAATAVSAIMAYWSGNPVYIWQAVVSQIAPTAATTEMT
jgi:hypothetical protein